MSFWRQLTRGAQRLLNPEAAGRDIADEVEHYSEEMQASLEASGLPAEEARRRARMELGSHARVHEQVRAYGWENLVESTVADLRYALRRLRRSPSFTLAAMVTLALGIGASTAIFSVVNPVLFRPLPYPDADRIMSIWDTGDGGRLAVTFGTFRELEQRSTSFESMAVHAPMQATLTGVDEPERIDGQFVSHEYFRVLGVAPVLGRNLQASDEEVHAPFVVILSHRLWLRRFGGDAGIIGRQIRFDDVPVTVIGVMPPGFENLLSPPAEIWSALRYNPALPLNGPEWGHHLRMVARLRPEVSLEQAAREIDAIAAAPQAEFPRPAWAALARGFIAGSLQEDLTRSVRPALLAIVGAVILLLTIACVNVTNLLLARGAERRAELAVRAALGASRPRLIRQILAEVLVLSSAGGALGIALASLAVDALPAMIPPELPRAGAIAMDSWTLAFAVGVTALAGLAIGAVPALDGSAGGLYRRIQQRSGRIATGRHLTRRTLMVVQVSLAFVLLVGASLLLRSLERLFSVPPGFDADNLLTMQVQTAGLRYRDAGAVDRFFGEAVDAVLRIPGVTAAAFASQLPLTGDEDVWGVHFESVPREAAQENRDGYRYAVSPGFLEAMGIPLLQGRALTESDAAGAPLAVVINEAFARRRIPGVDPIGQHLHIGPNSGPWYTVVGVAGNVTHASLAVSRSDMVYITAAQWERTPDNARWLVVRAGRDAAALAPAIREVIRSVDPGLPVLRIATMEQRLRDSTAQRRFALLLFEAFALVALLLAAVGSYSLLAGSVSERTREIGVRMALGASRGSILALMLRQGMALAACGVGLGGAGALFANRAIESLLFGVSGLDLASYAGVAVLLLAVSAAACGLPARRASRVSPVIALRSE